jgi:hypothetical protein
MALYFSGFRSRAASSRPLAAPTGPTVWGDDLADRRHKEREAQMRQRRSVSSHGSNSPVIRTRRRRSGLLAGLLVLVALPVFAYQAWAGQTLPTPVPATSLFNKVVDEGLADDQPGQKDLSLQGVYTPNLTDLWVMWQWDDTGLSGGNTGDACSLFDNDGDAKVNF